MKIIFLAKWNSDLPHETVAEALCVASEALAQGPFISCAHGPGSQLAMGGAQNADWGFVVEIDPDDMEQWRTSEAHNVLGRALRPICSEGMTIEF